MAPYVEFALVSVSVSRLVLHLRGVAQTGEDDSFLGALSGLPRHHVIDTEIPQSPLSDVWAGSDMTGQSRSQQSYHSDDRCSQQHTCIADSQESRENKREKDAIRYPFHSQSEDAKCWGMSLNIPSSSGSWMKKPLQRSSRLQTKNARNEDYFLADDSDSCMELSLVGRSGAREIRVLEVEEKTRTWREDTTEQLDRIKGEKVMGRSDLDIHGTGVG